MALITKTKKELAPACPQVTLKRSLGRGGNGCVYLAAHEDHGEVAVKFFLNSDRRRWQRFRDEVKVVTTHLHDSPRVVPILEDWLPEHGTDSVPWYIMPKAETIREVLKSLTWREMLPAFVELADGLVELHRAGVAHRDIKPENLFRFDGGYRFGDFGIAAFPGRAGITKEDEPIGPATFMAPEMEANSGVADCFLADVYSLAKTIWALLTREKFAFPGQYRPKGHEGLAARAKENGFVLEPLDLLLERATDSLPGARPSASEFSANLREVAAIQYDAGKANQLQWEFASLEAMTGQGIARAEWRDPAAVLNVIRLLSRYHGMNHCFLPEGGGQHIRGANLCEGGAMLSLQISGGGADYIVLPTRLVVERFPNHPAFGYAVLEVGEAHRLTEGDAFLDGAVEKLRRFNDFDYAPDDGDSDEPQFAGLGEPCYRRFKGGLMVFAPTYGIYNRIDKYNGTAERLGLEELRRQYGELVERLGTTKLEPRALFPVVRLLHRDVARVPFVLQSISMDQFWTLFDLDEQMLRARGDSGSAIVGSGELLEVLRSMSSDPKRQRAKALLIRLTAQQKGEYLALVDVARGIIDPHEMATYAEDKSRSSYDVSYLLEKLGNGYLRRALEKFGVEPVAETVAVEVKTEDATTQNDDFR
ncbi:hypothetical protein D0844_08315 [Bordetella avium]|uniref:protein kinase domain-containing protein n=1 Tax=Bordetella avium TaxID=521 RepID=UPI000E67F6F2|nr:protein kinase [Bordetella avium]RIQ54395.1 hypothetical protein D0844_08315 [Bordetella avium]